MIHSTSIIQLLNNLKETTNHIYQLDLEEEVNESLLLLLQDEQVVLRKQVEKTLLEEQRSFNEEEKQYLRDCMVLEQRNLQKFNDMKQSLTGKLKRLNSGNISRHVYQNNEEQHAGFFIDKHQ